MQKFRPNRLSEISVLGLKSAVFGSSNPTEPKNELGSTQNFFWALWSPFGADRNFFDHPTPKRSILGVQKFLQNRIFGPNLSGFLLWKAYIAPKWFSRHQKLFAWALEPLWCGPKKYRPPPPQKGRFGAAEISTKPILTIFSEKKNWSNFWSWQRWIIRRPDVSWEATVGQKCIIKRSQGSGSLPIEFKDDLQKYEKLPNSCLFSKLRVDSLMFHHE